MTSRTRFLQALTNAKLEFAALNLQDQTTLIVTKRGGRAFLFHDEKPVYWLPDFWQDDKAVEAFLSSGGWNMGGERVYVGPEIQYSVRDRDNFEETLFIPPGNDPGHYALTTNAHGVALEQTLELEAFNLARGAKRLELKRFFSTAANPLRQLRSNDHLMRGVKFAGYAQEVILSESSYDETVSESWLITQLPQRGNMLVPTSRAAEVTVFLGTPPPEVLKQHGTHFRIPFSGDEPYKLGFKAAVVTGRFAYVRDNLLLIRAFFNNPSSEYAEEVPQVRGSRGHSVFGFSDGGRLGGFGEIECNGQTIGVQGKSTTHDTFVTWLFTGERTNLVSVTEVLLGFIP